MTGRELLASFSGRRVLVIGDLMLDEYVHGRATRISQEAPVMVVRQNRFEAVPGGAANVAANLAALGADVALAGVVGDDEPGVRLQTALEERGTSRLALVRDQDRPTTRKTRILADAAHQVLRIDHE
ncbi:D-glycero-beta-D-manno-heptose-7-phosphate kinase, partial [bacterium]